MWAIEQYNHETDSWFNVFSYMSKDTAERAWNDVYGDLSSHRLIYVMSETFA